MRHLLILLCTFCFASTAVAADALDTSDLARIPVLHDGRVKPLDTFARHMLTQIYGHGALPGQSADAWLASVIFDPQGAAEAPIFRVDDKTVRAWVDVPERSPALYSFRELAAHLEKSSAMMQKISALPPEQLTQSQHHLIALYQTTSDFWELSRSMTLVLPIKNTGKKTYLDLFRYRARMALDAPKDPRAAVMFARLERIEREGQGSNIFRIIPPQWGSADGAWLSPWAVLRGGEGSPALAQFMQSWKGLALAYQTNDAANWENFSNHIRAQSITLAGGKIQAWQMEIEILYSQLSPFTAAMILYGVSLLLSFATARLKDLKNSPRWVEFLPVTLCIAGWIFHSLGIAMRMLILMRPPVSNLYESILFVSWVVASACQVAAIRTRIGGALSAAIPAALLLASFGFAPLGDTLGVVVAVLNTDFWLATHVVCITSGYSMCLLTAGLAQVWLWNERAQQTDRAALFKLMHTFAIFSLLFTAVGTVLGGIWADQSWGRFWGWDPKEDGALLIVLWLAWSLHGRVSAHFSQRGFAIALSALMIVVALSWLGVNLLGVGLHSYGFTNQAALGLGIFCAVEVLLIGWLGWCAKESHA